jgi:hypothetical protein
MNSLTPFIHHDLDNLPDNTHGLADGDMESRCVPCRQKNAREYLAGNTPGVMAFYAPETGDMEAQQALQPITPTADVHSHDLAAEDDETVLRLVEWREEAPYG